MQAGLRRGGFVWPAAAVATAVGATLLGSVAGTRMRNRTGPQRMVEAAGFVSQRNVYRGNHQWMDDRSQGG